MRENADLLLLVLRRWDVAIAFVGPGFSFLFQGFLRTSFALWVLTWERIVPAPIDWPWPVAPTVLPAQLGTCLLWLAGYFHLSIHILKVRLQLCYVGNLVVVKSSRCVAAVCVICSVNLGGTVRNGSPQFARATGPYYSSYFRFRSP